MQLLFHRPQVTHVAQHVVEKTHSGMLDRLLARASERYRTELNHLQGFRLILHLLATSGRLVGVHKELEAC